MKSKLLLAALTAGVFGLCAVPASADIVFTPGNHPQPDEANILFGAKQTGNPIDGEVDHTGVDASFSTLTGQTLVQNSKGQADISAQHGDLTSIEFSLETGFFFNDFIMNLMGGTGTAIVTVQTQGKTDSFLLGNGQNFLTITTTNGDLMTSVSVTMQDGIGGWRDFKQPRVSGLCEVSSPNGACVPIGLVPEPATLLLIGLGLGGLGLTRRRKAS